MPGPGPKSDLGPRDRAFVEMLQSAEAAPVITSAFYVCAYSESGMADELAVAQATFTCFRNRLLAAYSNCTHDFKFMKLSPDQMVECTINVAVLYGICIPAVEQAARRVGLDLEAEAEARKQEAGSSVCYMCKGMVEEA